MADTVGQSGALPPITFLNMEKVKRETSAYNHHHPVTSAISMPAPSLVSPSLYSGPPPPYSYPSSAASSTISGDRGGPGAGHQSYIPPAETRRTSGDEKESLPSQRLSLPSITQALGGEQQPLSISSLLSTGPPQQKNTVAAHSPTSAIARSYLEALPKGPSSSYPQSADSTYRPSETSSDRNMRPMHSPALPTTNGDSRFPALDSFSSMKPYHSHPPVPALQGITSSSTYRRPGASPIQHVQHNLLSSPLRDRVPHTTAPSTSTPYAYNSQVPYTYPPTTPGLSSYRTPTLDHPPWKNHGPDYERAEEIRKVPCKESPPRGTTYGVSVKRHLDNFELEASLNDIAEGSGKTLDFSREYGIRAHQTHRSGPSTSSMPSLNECDDMIQQQMKVLDAMNRIRDVICKQQQALLEQRSYDQHSHKPTASEADDDANSYADKLDGSGGFAGSDAKKRRGRAAPPGRCHSCNRAETPEWRRGPDGARTLCNACGLHYAKLTRKMGTKGPAGSSNLRPKESSPSSP